MRLLLLLLLLLLWHMLQLNPVPGWYLHLKKEDRIITEVKVTYLIERSPAIFFANELFSYTKEVFSLSFLHV